MRLSADPWETKGKLREHTGLSKGVFEGTRDLLHPKHVSRLHGFRALTCFL